MSETEPIIPTLNQVVGQQRAVRVLRTALDAYWNERSKTGEEGAFPHFLVTGASGTGKTTLTELVARELCTKVEVQLAQNIATISQMQGLLMMLEPGHILLIDENPSTQRRRSGVPVPCAGGSQAVPRRQSKAHRLAAVLFGWCDDP